MSMSTPLHQSPRPTFRQWLATQCRRGDPIGDLAEDVAYDRCCTATTYADIRRHLQVQHQADEKVIEALAAAYHEWRREAYPERGWCSRHQPLGHEQEVKRCE